METYRTIEGDVLALVVASHYGDINDEVFQVVLNENEGISSLPLILPIGTVIHLPVLTEKKIQTIPKKALWS